MSVWWRMLAWNGYWCGWSEVLCPVQWGVSKQVLEPIGRRFKWSLFSIKATMTADILCLFLRPVTLHIPISISLCVLQTLATHRIMSLLMSYNTPNAFWYSSRKLSSHWSPARDQHWSGDNHKQQHITPVRSVLCLASTFSSLKCTVHCLKTMSPFPELKLMLLCWR